MSNSLNFSQSEDAHFNHGVISTPPVGRQPSFVQPSLLSQDSSLSLIRDNLTSEAQREYLDNLLNTALWCIFRPVGNQNWKLHKQNPGTLQFLKDRRAEAGYTMDKSRKFYAAVQCQKATHVAARKYLELDRSWVAEQARNGSPQYANELFFPDVAFKPAFDLDMRKEESPWDLDTDLGKAQFIVQFVAECAVKLGYSSDITCYQFIWTTHDDKFSLHVIVNCALHYASNKHMLAHLKECDFNSRRFFVDTHLYATHAQLRIPYSGKWDDKPYAPALIMGVHHEDVNSEMIASCLAQFVPAESRLIEVELAAQNGYRRNLSSDIQTALEALRVRFEAPDLEASAMNDLQGTFDCDGLACPCDHRGAKVVLQHRTKTMRVQCSSFCREFELGFTPKQQMYLEQYEFLKYLYEKGWCRLDVPIFKGDSKLRDFGYIQLDPYTFQKLQGEENPREWVYFYVNPRKGKLVDIEFFNFVRDKQFRDMFDPHDPMWALTRELLCAYLDLMVAKVSDTDKFYIRTKDGIKQVSSASVKQDLGGCCYEVTKKIGRGENAEYVVSEKPFFTIYEKFGNFCRGGITYGPLGKLDDRRFAFPPTKAMDVNECLKDWMELGPRDKLCLQSLWSHYKKMAVAFEMTQNPVTAKAGAEFLERWTCQIMFDSFSQTKVCPVFISAGGGQGKSTLGNFIASFLGLQLSTTGRTAKDLLLNQFTKGTNNFRLLDEVFLTMEMVEKLKEVITGDYFKAEGKGVDAVHEVNRTNHIITSNKEFVLAVNQFGVERRFLVFQFLAISMFNEMEDGKFFFHRCMCSGRTDQFGDSLPCLEHSFHDHRSFIGLWHSLITKRIDDDGVVAEYQTGQFFSPFVGMLYSIFLENKVEWAKVPIARCVPDLMATKQAQSKVKGNACKLVEDWVTQGYVFSAAANPDKLNSSWKVINESLNTFLQDRVALSHKWAEYIPKSTVYQLYCEACTRKGWTRKSEDIFFTELDQVWMEKTGHPMTYLFKKLPVATLRYERTGPMKPDYVNTGALPTVETCIYFGTGREFFNQGRPIAEEEAPAAPPQPQAVVAHAPLAREQARPQPRAGQSANYIDPAEEVRNIMRESTRMAGAQAAYERELELEQQEQSRLLKRAHDAWDAEDAQDGYDADEISLRVHKKVTKSLSLSDCVDEAEQDRVAAAQDALDEIRDEEGDVIMGAVPEDEEVEEISSEVVFSSMSQ